jgi:hypothetical protein
VLLGRRGELAGANEAGARLLTELPDDHVPVGQPIPLPVLAVATRVRCAGAGDDASAARARARTRDGRWMVPHGTRLADPARRRHRGSHRAGPSGQDGRAHPARSRADHPEREIASLVLQGVLPPRPAAALRLSLHTV